MTCVLQCKSLPLCMHQLKQRYPVGWFFAIFAISDQNSINPSITNSNLQNDRILSPTYTLKRKRNRGDLFVVLFTKTI